MSELYGRCVRQILHFLASSIGSASTLSMPFIETPSILMHRMASRELAQSHLQIGLSPCQKRKTRERAGQTMSTNMYIHKQKRSAYLYI